MPQISEIHAIQQRNSASPFSSRIGTNYLPITDEVTQIKEYIAKNVVRVAEVDQEIKRLEALRDKLTMEIEDHQSLLSPVHHIPSDILQEIFTACLPQAHNPVLSRHEAPLLLTRVCKNWRNVMFSTPHLWSAIHIPIPSYPVNPNSQELPVGGLSDYSSALLALIRECATTIHEWLDRSKGSPLSISVYDSGNCSDEVCDLILDTIIHFSPRWKSLLLDTQHLNLTRIAKLVPSQVPLLESFAVLNEAAIQNTQPLNPLAPSLLPFNWSMSEIIKAPKLRAVSFPQMTENIIDFPLKWSQMTQISLGSSSARTNSIPMMTLNEVAFILQSCQKLVSLRLEIILLPGAVDKSHSTICLPSLKAFSFHDSGVDVSSLFAILELPSLKRLEFNSNASYLKQSPLEMLLPRITTLEWLITERQFFAEAHYMKCLSHMPCLSHISIRWSPFFRTVNWSPSFDDQVDVHRVVSDDLFAWFTTPDLAGEYPVPSLEYFECYTTSEFTDAALVEFIKKRHSIPGIKPLKRVYIGFSRPKTVDVIEDVGEEISKELDLDLRYPYSSAALLTGPVVFFPFAGIHPYPPAFLTTGP